MTEDILERLDTLIDLLRRPASPVQPEDDLWSSAEVGAYLKRSPRQVTERYAVLPDFPRAIYLPSDGAGRSKPLWPARDVMAWAAKHRR